MELKERLYLTVIKNLMKEKNFIELCADLDNKLIDEAAYN
jgi:hypothetical protein